MRIKKTEWINVVDTDKAANNFPVSKKKMIQSLLYCNVCEMLLCKLVYMFIVFGKHGRYIGNINQLW